MYFDAPFACFFLRRLRGFRWPSASPATALSDFRAADERHAPRRAGVACAILDDERQPPAFRRHRHRCGAHGSNAAAPRSEEHTSELQSLMRISYAVFCLKKKTIIKRIRDNIKFILRDTPLDYILHKKRIEVHPNDRLKT